MDFELNEEQRLLAESVQRYLGDQYEFEKRRGILASIEGHSPQVWQALAEMGLMALPLPEVHGGFGGGAVDLMSAMETFGDVLLVEPFVPTVALAARLVDRCGSEAQRAELLPRVADGSLKMAFAHLEREARHERMHVTTRATRDGDGWKLDGEKLAVIGAPLAERIVVSARTGGLATEANGVSLYLVDPKAAGVTLSSFRTIDGFRGAHVRLDGVRVAAQAVLGDGAAAAAIEEALDFATALQCAEASGAIQSANAATLDYLKTRKQFGVPIGSFQALQHRMVDMFIVQEQIRSMVRLVCSRVDTAEDAAERARAVSAAKILVADGCRKVSQEAIQLHGGMGMSEEMKVSHTFRRLTMIAQELGDADFHLERFAMLDR